MIRVLIAVAATSIALAHAAHAEPSVRARAAAVLEALGEDQQGDAHWPFDDDEREDIHYAPIGLDGIQHGELDPEQAGLVDALLEAVLSARGMQTVRQVRELELAVLEKERSRFYSFVMRSIRDPGRYLLALFGDPADAGPWGFRYEGHHLSLNITEIPGQPLSTTPLFLGAEPRIVPEGWPSAGVAVLGEEERLARALYESLPDALRARATLPYDDGRALMLGEVRRVAESDGPGGSPRGVPRGEMSEDSQALLDQLIERFVGLFEPATARQRRAEIHASGLDAVRFAFAATQGEDPPNGFYVRLQGPRMLLEIDNTSDGDHVHAVWHDARSDFGTDALARHWRDQHGVSISSITRSDMLAMGELDEEP